MPHRVAEPNFEEYCLEVLPVDDHKVAPTLGVYVLVRSNFETGQVGLEVVAHICYVADAGEVACR